MSLGNNYDSLVYSNRYGAKKMNDERGVIYIATGEKYVDLAARFAQSREELFRTTLMKEKGNHHFSSYGHEFYARLTEDFVLGLLQPGKVS